MRGGRGAVPVAGRLTRYRTGIPRHVSPRRDLRGAGRPPASGPIRQRRGGAGHPPGRRTPPGRDRERTGPDDVRTRRCSRRGNRTKPVEGNHEKREKHKREEPRMNADERESRSGLARFESGLINSSGMFFVSFVLLTICYFACREDLLAPRRACLGGGVILHYIREANAAAPHRACPGGAMIGHYPPPE